MDSKIKYMPKSPAVNAKQIVKKLSVTIQDKYNQSSENYWLRGLIQGVPAVGGTLDTWFFQFAEKEKQKRVESALKAFTKRISNIEDQIDVEYIEQHIEEYAFLFEKFLKYVSQEYRVNLRRKFVNLMSNLSTKEYSKQQNKDVFLSKLSELTPEHLVVLQLAYNYTFTDGKQDYEKTKTVKEYIVKELREKGLEEAIIYAILTDLQSKGLINETYHPTFGGGLYTYHVTALAVAILKLVG
ncbi:MAG: hypothetical protein GYA14_16385 [Ignavibacteria bacterium]|nr:hypothetical protein [Ignavibacteria bacterium]